MVENVLGKLKRIGVGIRGGDRPTLEGVHLVVLGLGNPGPEYSDTRHNAGANAVRRMLRGRKVRLRRVGKYVRAARIDLGDAGHDRAERSVAVVVAVPLTFMNDSGTAAAWLVERCKIPVEQLMIIHDDLDLPLGSVRLKFGGGSGGHRGVESVIRALGSNAFQRVRIGIGRPPEGVDAVHFVLSPFATSEVNDARDAVSAAAEAVEVAAVQGIDAAMNLYNRAESGTAV